MSGEELFNVEAERGVLLGLLTDGPEVWPIVRQTGLTVEAISPDERVAFRVLTSLAERGVLATVPAIRETAVTLGESQFAQSVGDWANALVDGSGLGLANTEYYAGIVVELWHRRRARALAQSVAASVADRTKPFAEMVADAVSNFLALATPARQAARDDGLWSALEDLEATANLNGAIPGVTTGLAQLDHLTDGFVPERLIVIAARPGVGKTAFSTHAGHMGAEAGAEIYFVSLEQPVKQLQQRRLAIATGLNLWQIKRQTEQWKQHARAVSEAAQSLKDAPLTFDANAETVTQISLAVQRHSTTVRPVQVLFIDYLSWIRFEGPKADRHDLAIGEITKRLARLAKTMHVAVVLLVQLNRESVKDGKSRRPTLADLRDSGAIEQDADQVILLWEPPSDLGPDALHATVEFVVGKNRHGPLGTARAVWSKATNTYTDCGPRLRSVAA